MISTFNERVVDDDDNVKQFTLFMPSVANDVRYSFRILLSQALIEVSPERFEGRIRSKALR